MPNLTICVRILKNRNPLLARLKVLQPAYGLDNRKKSRPTDEILSLPERPRKSRADRLPFESSKFLLHIQLIHQGIVQVPGLLQGVHETPERWILDRQ